MKLKPLFAAICSAAVLAMTVTDVSAAGVRVTCEKRADRSKISVDGDGLATGSYKAIVISGANTKTSVARPTVGDEVKVMSPGGIKELEILKLTTIHDEVE